MNHTSDDIQVLADNINYVLILGCGRYMIPDEWDPELINKLLVQGEFMLMDQQATAFVRSGIMTLQEVLDCGYV